MVISIAQGSNCTSVRIAKYLTGYSADGKATSKYDAAFATYVKRWKKAHGGQETDQIGRATWALIAQHCDAAQAGNKVETRALRIALGMSESDDYNATVKGIVKAIQTGCGLVADGICGPKTWAVILRLNAARNAHTVNYRQNDSRWANVNYSYNGKVASQTIGNSGCGPTSMADVAYTLGGDHTVTPVTMCELAVQAGFRKKSGGTDKEFFSYCAKKWNLNSVKTTYTTVVKHCLDSGGIVICRFKPGSWWTKVGHFSPCWKYDKSYYYVDNTYVTIGLGKHKRAIRYLSKDCREFFCFYPKEVTG